MIDPHSLTYGFPLIFYKNLEEIYQYLPNYKIPLTSFSSPKYKSTSQINF